MKVLELFSGTHSIGKVCKELGYECVSLDRDLPAKDPMSDFVAENHIMEDIMEWDYKQFSPGEFDIITASPVCLWWSKLRNCWIGRKCKKIHPTDVITKQHLEDDIENLGKPMVDRVREILDYLKPKYYWIENPNTSKMKYYITDLPFYDVDYCKYSDWGYKKRTRIWTNIKGFDAQKCKNDCGNTKFVGTRQVHKVNLASNDYIVKDGKTIMCNSKALREKYKEEIKEARKKRQKIETTKYERYRIPLDLIRDLFTRAYVEHEN